MTDSYVTGDDTNNGFDFRPVVTNENQISGYYASDSLFTDFTDDGLSALLDELASVYGLRTTPDWDPELTENGNINPGVESTQLQNRIDVLNNIILSVDAFESTITVRPKNDLNTDLGRFMGTLMDAVGQKYKSLHKGEEFVVEAAAIREETNAVRTNRYIVVEFDRGDMPAYEFIEGLETGTITEAHH